MSCDKGCCCNCPTATEGIAGWFDGREAPALPPATVVRMDMFPVDTPEAVRGISVFLSTDVVVMVLLPEEPEVESAGFNACAMWNIRRL